MAYVEVRLSFDDLVDLSSDEVAAIAAQMRRSTTSLLGPGGNRHLGQRANFNPTPTIGPPPQPCPRCGASRHLADLRTVATGTGALIFSGCYECLPPAIGADAGVRPEVSDEPGLRGLLERAVAALVEPTGYRAVDALVDEARAALGATDHQVAPDSVLDLLPTAYVRFNP